jgi:hypothetical protein
MMAVKHLHQEEEEEEEKLMTDALAVFFDGVDSDRVGWVVVFVADHRMDHQMKKGLTQ